MLNAFLIGSLCFIWGATWVAIKIGLSESPPFFGAAFRFLLASVVLGLALAVRRHGLPRDRRILAWILASGLFMYFGSYAAVYWAEQYINAGLAAIIFASFPFFVAIGAHFHLPGERLSWLKVLGLIIGFAGIVVIFGGGLTMPDARIWWAMLVMLISPFSSAVASIMVKKHLTQEDPTVVNFLQMIVGVLVLFPFAFANEQLAAFHWSLVSIAAVSFLGIFGSAYTFVTYYHLLKTIEASRMALIAFVTPVVAAVLGWLILDETLALSTLLGAVLVFAGIYIVNVMARKPVPQVVRQPTGGGAAE